MGLGCAGASQVCPLFLGPLVLGGCGGTQISTFLCLWCVKSRAGVEPSEGGSVQGARCHSCSFTPLGSPCSLQFLVQSGPCHGSAPGFPCALGWAGASPGLRFIQAQACAIPRGDPGHGGGISTCLWCLQTTASCPSAPGCPPPCHHCRLPLAITRCPLTLAIPP